MKSKKEKMLVCINENDKTEFLQLRNSLIEEHGGSWSYGDTIAYLVKQYLKNRSS